MSLAIGLGPLDENETTAGANESMVSVLLNMVAIESLAGKEKKFPTLFTLW